MKAGLIDMHHHARPAAFFQALARTGRISMGGRPFPPGWTAQEALGLMDEMGVATALLSAPDADLLYRDRSIALELSRLMNELFASSIRSHPGRFGGFASLPMPHLDDALQELTHALDRLTLDGAMLSTSYDGRYLGDSGFDPLLSELDRRSAVVFVHPVSPLGMSFLRLDFPAALLEYAFDTTRCIANLLRHEVPERYPNINFIFSHAGGAAPYLVERLSFMDYYMEPGRSLQPREDRVRLGGRLRSFYYDTALSSTDPVLSLLGATVGTERLVFGSDYPQVPRDFIRASVDSVLSSPAVSDADRRLIARGNAAKLFPRLAG